MAEKKRAVGNGVQLSMGRALALAVIEVYSNPVIVQRDLIGQVTPVNKCRCGCGREVSGKALYYDYSCRKRAQRKRESVTDQVGHNNGHD
jgi:DNA (cytosine-5)-methyltransferase 1